MIRKLIHALAVALATAGPGHALDTFLQHQGGSWETYLEVYKSGKTKCSNRATSEDGGLLDITVEPDDTTTLFVFTNNVVVVSPGSTTLYLEINGRVWLFRGTQAHPSKRPGAPATFHYQFPMHGDLFLEQVQTSDRIVLVDPTTMLPVETWALEGTARRPRRSTPAGATSPAARPER